MEKYEVVKVSNSERNKMSNADLDMQGLINGFAVKLFNTFNRNTIIPMNRRTSVAVSACIMFNDFTEGNRKLMESGNIGSELNRIIFAISKLNETTNVISLMNESLNMYDCVSIFSSKYYGEIYPEKMLSRKMCFVNKIESAICLKKI